MGVKADKAIATYRRMRAQPLWRLLASTTGPTVIGLLQSHLYEGERSLPASIFHERIARDLEELRAQGEDFPQTAQAYVASGASRPGLQKRNMNSPRRPSKPFALSLAWCNRTPPRPKAA
jgi:hypothetical protein